MNAFLLYMLKVGACLSLFYGLFWLCLKNETYFHLNRFYLVSSLVLAFILPAFPVASPFLMAPPAGFPPAPAFSAPAARSLNVAAVLPFLYAAGAAFFLLRLGIHLIRLAGVVRRSGIRRAGAFRIVAVDRDFAPFSFLGLVFINGRRTADADLRRILAHEQVHVRQGHTLDVLLMELVVVLQWFNPFVWPYKKALRETHEYLADAGVIAQGYGPLGYRRLVFEQHVGAALFEFGNNFKQSQIKRRITMMSKNPSSGASRLKLLLAVPLVLGLVLVFAYPRAAAPPGSSITPPRSGQTSPPPDKAELKLKAEKLIQECRQLEQLDKEIGLKLEQAGDDATKKELGLKRDDVRKKLQHCRQALIDTGVAPPPADKSDMMKLKAEYKMLDEKAAEVRAEIEKTDDPAKKAELKATLEKIAAKQEDIKKMASHDAALGKKITLDDLKKMSVELEAKGAEVKAQLDKTEDASKKAELKEILQKIQQKQADVKSKIHELESAKTVK